LLFFKKKKKKINIFFDPPNEFVELSTRE